MATLETVPQYEGEVVRCLVTVGDEETWYSRLSGTSVGDVDGDIELADALRIGRFRRVDAQDRFLINRATADSESMADWATANDALWCYVGTDAGIVALRIGANDSATPTRIYWALADADAATLATVDTTQLVNIVVGSSVPAPTPIPPAPAPSDLLSRVRLALEGRWVLVDYSVPTDPREPFVDVRLAGYQQTDRGRKQRVDVDCFASYETADGADAAVAAMVEAVWDVLLTIGSALVLSASGAEPDSPDAAGGVSYAASTIEVLEA